MRHILSLTCMLVPALCLSAESLSFSRVAEATYAIHTRFTVGGDERVNREAYLYRMEFMETQGADGLEADAYRLKKLDMISDATRYSHGEVVGYLPGGQLPFLMALWRRGAMGAILSPEALFKKPLLFPVLENLPAEVVDGSEWETTISPVILEEDVSTKVISGEMAVSNLPPAVVKNRVVAHETLNGRACVRISSTLSVKSPHGATAEYKIESYFDVSDKIPVMNIVEGNGTILDHQNQQKTFAFYRKETLVSATFPTD